MIDGVIVKQLSIIADERGSVMHMLRADDPEFERFGEIYFSTIYPGVVKGWHMHTRTTLNYAVVAGMIKLVLFDDRPSSLSHGRVEELFVGERNYVLVRIPPRVWNGFKGIGTSPAIVANCATFPHDPEDIVRMDPFSRQIPYDWHLVNR
jgi:dTDP-4-dehydrorhamnose 3,5-epimerase